MLAPHHAPKLLALTAAAAAFTSHGHTIYQSPYLWATVDLCNTPRHPDTIGIRASIPGSGFATERMFIRFELQYQLPGGRWSALVPGAGSPWIDVGSGSFRAPQAGRSFTLASPPGLRSTTPTDYVLRGVVAYQWRRRSRIVRRAVKPTSAGHQVAAGADPPGYSAAGCQMVFGPPPARGGPTGPTGP